MAPNKKGLSLEEKRKKMMEIFYETKDVFLLKDLEKIAPKSKGITMMSVKDVVTSLVDDGLIDTEKIGTSVYFWAFPSKASQARKKKLEMSEEKCLKMVTRMNDLEKEVTVAEKGREDTKERQELLERLKEEKEKRDKMLVRLKDFADNDPAVLEQMVRETGQAVEAVNRWTDNIFSIQGWIKKKFPSVDQASFSKQFGIPEDLDYLE
eukprot:GFUD01016395.1.p1 GENE.GFUD01016395.1~~GFUD01016395.1.p1  ORF type:complete len:208 (+),score=89.18 GFUD01016395.1:68-691(+)